MFCVVEIETILSQDSPKEKGQGTNLAHHQYTRTQIRILHCFYGFFFILLLFLRPKCLCKYLGLWKCVKFFFFFNFCSCSIPPSHTSLSLSWYIFLVVLYWRWWALFFHLSWSLYNLPRLPSIQQNWDSSEQKVLLLFPHHHPHRVPPLALVGCCSLQQVRSVTGENSTLQSVHLRMQEIGNNYDSDKDFKRRSRGK